MNHLLRLKRFSLNEKGKVDVIPRICLIIGFFFLISMNSCRSKYEVVSPQSVNDSIRYDVSIMSPAEVMRVIYLFPDNNSVVLDWKQLKKPNTYKITLVHSNLEDDSVEAYKYIVYAEYNGMTWRVTKIKRTHRCWENRGHTRWGIKKCY